ncbi:MAG TPA: DNA-3-methyladenine glycosylase, partial [Candidatus Paceibacterota bacterium]|nr:DNA-3-methyladenine glycosylase [Candidatus Paceibacterota bacterium]
FDRPSPEVARDLIGKFLVRTLGKKKIAFMVTEVEAYGGSEDKASHARFGKTIRTTPMFNHPGIIYVFFTYGMHFMLNIVTGKEHEPSAVLIRAAGNIVGPARLAKALAIDKTLNNLPLSKKSGLWIEDRGIRLEAKQIKKTPRIGIDYAGLWVKKLWRFVLKENKTPRYVPRRRVTHRSHAALSGKTCDCLFCSNPPYL